MTRKCSRTSAAACAIPIMHMMEKPDAKQAMRLSRTRKMPSGLMDDVGAHMVNLACVLLVA